MQPQNIIAGQGVDREGAMAKADLYKLANYSLKLFKQLEDDAQMESWVQAKITKAADYIASVYHYLEYEMKFNDYGHQLDNAELVNEDQKIELKNKLLEAKSKIAELKKSQAEKMKAKDSKKVEEGILNGGDETCTECGGTGMVYREAMPVPDHVKSKVEKYKRLTKATHAAHKRLDRNNNGIPDSEEDIPVDEEFTDKSKTGDTFKTRTGVATKTDTGMKHNNTSYADDGEAEQKSGKGVKSHAKSQSAAEKKDKAPAQKQSPKSAKTWGMKDSEKFDNRDKPVDETYGQGVYQEGKKSKPDFLDMDKDGNKKEPMKKAVADKKAGPKKGVNPFAKKVDETLKGKQKHLDVDGDGDIEEDDLADLRANKKEKKVSEAAKWRDAKHKDKLYTQEPRDYDQYDYHDDDYYNGPKPDDYPGEKNLKGGGEFDHNDPLVKGYGRGGTGSMNTHGKRKGMPSRNHVSSLKGSIKSAQGTHPRPNLPEAAKQTVQESSELDRMRVLMTRLNG